MLTLIISCGLLPTIAVIWLGLSWKSKWNLLEQANLQRQEIQLLLKNFEKEQTELRQRFDQHQINSLMTLQEGLHKALQELRTQVTSSLTQYSEIFSKRMDELIKEVTTHLQQINQEVDKQLSLGFEKTTATFADVMKRLIIIDEAQKKITELSNNVVNLKEILIDKRSRGAFGEVQLITLIRNVIPEAHFSLQHTLGNSKRVDCLLLLPPPSGNIAIDSKFPLESYSTLIKTDLSEIEKRQAEQRFRLDIRKHIEDIADKYIFPPETAEGAMMFIPAEAIFAEIHAHFPDIVELAQRAKVWMVSPTTMLAVLTTARAVLKDADTRKQVHVIQEHLNLLSKDFARFAERMDNLARHIDQAHKDVNEVHLSSKKISSRFEKIEKVDLKEIHTVL
jgi:DNA recombination protein RmuC